MRKEDNKVVIVDTGRLSALFAATAVRWDDLKRHI